MPLTKGKKPTILDVKNLSAEEKMTYIAIGIWWIERKIDALKISLDGRAKKVSSEERASE